MNKTWQEINGWLDRFLTSAVKTIILINVAVTVALLVTYAIAPLATDRLVGLLAQNPELSVKRFFVWQFLTYMFVHIDVFHLLMNMLVLFFFGPTLEKRWGSKEFWKFYLITGIGAGLLHAIIVLLTGVESRTVYHMGQIHEIHPQIIGASGAIFGIMLAYAAYYPNQIVLVYMVFPIKIKYLMIILGVIEFMSTASGSNNGISNLTHLTGLGIAYLLLYWRHRRWDISKWQYSRW